MADNPYMQTAEELIARKSESAITPFGENPYMDKARQVAEQKQQQLKGILDIVSPVSPDEAAETLKLSRTSGLPEDTVRDNLIEVRRRERVRQLNAQRVLNDSPVLAQQLFNPTFAAISQDQIPPMSSLEMAGSFLTRSLGSGILTLTGAATKTAESLLSWAGILTPEEDIAVLFKNDPAGMQKILAESPGTALSRWARAQQKLANEIMAGAPDEVKAKYSGLEYFTDEPENAAYLSPVRVIGDAFQSLPTTLALMVSMYMTKNQAASTYAGLIDAGVALEVAAKEAARAAATTMARVSALTEGVAGYAVQANQARLDADKVSQAELEQSPEYQRLIKDGFAPEAARVYLSAIASERAGTIAGIVDAITNFYGGKVLGRVIGEGGAILPRTAKGFATEGATELVQSMGEQTGQNYAIQQLLNPNQGLTEGVAEAGAAGLVVGGVTGGFFSAALGRAQQAQNEAGRANVMFDMLNRLNDLSAASKVRERDVQSFESFMQSIEQDSGGPVNTLYIAPQTLIETLVKAGVNIAQAKQTLPSLANLDEQLQTGTMVSIPVSEFAARMAGSEYAQALLPQLKTDPNGMSKLEADEYMKSQGDALKAEVEKVLTEAQADNAFKADMDQVKQQVLAEISGTQRFTKDVNEAYATLMSTFYGVNAAKLGISPSEMAAKYPIRISAQAINEGQTYDQNGNLKTDTANFKSWFKQSKVVDEQGKPLEVYHGTAKDFSQFTDTRGRNQSFMQKLAKALGLEQTSGDFFFASNPGLANSYAGLEGGNVKQVYLSIQNPAYYQQGVSQGSLLDALKQAKENGHDGMVVRNWNDPLSPVSDVYIAFDSKQIKSVFNNGEFDPNNPDTLFQRGVQPDGRVVPESVDKVSNVESAFEFAGTKSFATNRDFKIAIQERVNEAAKAAKVNLEEFSKATEEYLVRMGLADGLTALRTNANAVGWYNEKVTKALRLVSLIHPEVATDPQSKFAFVWAMAVTSNGLKVDKNFELAEQAYQGWKDSGGVMPTDIGIGTAAGPINNSLGLYNTLIEKHGFEVVEQFMTTMQKAGEVEKFTGQNISGENLTTMVYGAAALGPKIGNGFFMNLYGRFEQLTMDRWLMRTWGRWTGTLVEINQAQIKAKRNQIKEVIKALSPADKKAFEAIIKRKLTVGNPDEVAVAVWKASQKKANRIEMAKIGMADEAGLDQLAEIFGAAKKGQVRVSFGDELRKVGNALTKYLDGQKEMPDGPPERANIRKVFGRVLAELQKTYPTLTMSDYQALLWYPEKRLYDAAKTADDAVEGYDDEEAPDYANAAAKLARARGISDADIAATLAAVDEELRAAVSTAGVRPGERGPGDSTAGQAGTYNQSQPTFYSQLARSVEQAKQSKAPASDWISILSKTPGVKAEEMEWTGLKDYLTLLGKEQVTKQEITDYLNANGVQVQEVMRESARGTFKDIESAMRYLMGQDMTEEDVRNEYGYIDDQDYIDLANEMRSDQDNDGTTTKYDSYTLPGGENYRELLLTLPGEFEFLNAADNKVNEISARSDQLERQGVPEDDPRWIAVQEEFAQAVAEREAAYDRAGRMQSQGIYRSGHWNEGNILAHIRFNERTDADGKRVLFIEELQSDWAQEGRKKGFKRSEQELAKFDAEIEAIDKEVEALRAEGFESPTDDTPQSEVDPKFIRVSELLDRRMQIQDEMRNVNRIPQAPFVTDTKGWLNLALKRMIRYAAENGFDKVAFVNGQQSADRYALSTQVRELGWNARPDGSRFIAMVLVNSSPAQMIVDKDGKVTKSAQISQAVGKPLDEVLGKDLANKIMTEEDNYLEGQQIDIGGEGMKSFYDKIVPNAVSALIKKMDGKLETVDLSSQDGRSKYVIDAENIEADDNAQQEVIIRDEKTLDGVATFNSIAEAEAWLANNDVDVGAAQQLGFTITDKMREMVMQGQPLFQGEGAARGSISFGQDITQTPSVITLFNSANLSTFLHESGHFFLEVYADIASRPDAPAEIVQDMNAVLRWFGVENIQTWRGMDIEAKRPYHEKFARGFEAYLFEGKSPNQELAGYFQRFRAWLINVYKQITALNVELDDEIRAVFDRMVASNESIREAEQARSYVPLFTTKPPFMSDDEWKAYQQSDLEASQSAVEDLQTRSLRDMQWLSNAKSRILKALQKDAAEKRKEVRREVEAEVMGEPVYRAREFLKRGTIDGEKVEGGYKLSLPEIEQIYEGNPILGLIKSSLGFGKYGMLGAENGIHPTQVAELFGFSSGDHLVRSLLEAPDPRQIIEQRTDARMLERYGDLNSPQAMSRAADEAIHNDARARFAATEANALAKATGRPKVLASAAKQYARELISRLKIRDIRPGQYAASATRAAKNAAKPGIDLIEAATEKRNQVINTYAAKEAFNAQDEVIKAVRYLRKFDNKNIAKVVHPDYLDQIHALLDRFDLRTSTSLRDIEKRRALIEWVQSEQAKGNEPMVPDKLLNEAYRVSYKEMTLEDFRGLIDAVRNIEHLGRLKDKLLKIQDQREFKAVVADASEAIRENAYKDVAQQLERRGLKDAVVKGGREILAWHRKFSSLIRQMDGFKDGGVLWQTFLRPMNDAGTQEASMREQATVKLGALYDMMGKVKLGKQEYIEEIGNSLSMEARLAVALNMGNEINMRRVMEGEGWNAGQVNAIVRSLTREQWNFVQGVWDLLNSYWPEISAKERRMTGIVPEKVESRPFTVTLADGTQMSLAGGYYPIKYNAERSSRAQADTAADVLKQMERGLYARAQTARGHLQSRVESVGRPLRYDLGVIEQHLNQVIHDLSWHEYLVDANRLLRADPVDSAIRDHYGPEVLNVMRKTMEDIAIGELPAMNTFEKSIRWMRTGSSIAAMGWSIMTAAQQPTGLSQSIKRIGPKWVAMGASRWLRDAASFENTAAWVNGKSEFMRLRSKTQMREMNEIRNTVEKGGVASAVTGSFFYLTAKLQMVADMPTWLGQYEKAMAEGADEPRAIALADQAVLDSQGGGQVKDLAMVQKGNEFQKLWTNFYSYFSVTYNLLAESVNETRKVGPSRLPLLAVDVLLLTVVPATLGFLIKGALRGFGDDDDEALAKKLVAENVNYLLGTMIGLRELGAAVSGSMGYEGPAGARFFADVAKFIKQAEQGEADEAFWRSANQMGGVLLHYPAVQIDRTVRGIQALSDGTTDNPLAILGGPPPRR